ncbi:MAG TPA: hypothetical protein VE444_00660, partial [Gaiellaceae bacterium]|nr:hypothetical protein [Gaiellaceae bacterium]
SGAEAQAAAERCDGLEHALGQDAGLAELDSTLEALHRANASFLRRAKTLVAERTSLAGFLELTRAHLAEVAADEFRSAGRS